MQNRGMLSQNFNEHWISESNLILEEVHICLKKLFLNGNIVIFLETFPFQAVFECLADQQNYFPLILLLVTRDICYFG